MAFLRGGVEERSDVAPGNHQQMTVGNRVAIDEDPHQIKLSNYVLGGRLAEQTRAGHRATSSSVGKSRIMIFPGTTTRHVPVCERREKAATLRIIPISDKVDAER